MAHIWMLGHLSHQLLQGEALWLITFGLLGVDFFAFVQLGLLDRFLGILCELDHLSPQWFDSLHVWHLPGHSAVQPCHLLGHM